MFEVGDVVRFHSSTVGKPKYHLCVGYDEHGGPRLAFLFVNSETGYRGDCVFEDGEIPGLPESRTSESIVSFTNITRIGEDKLKLFKAEKVGKISGDVAGVLAAFARDTKVLTAPEKRFVVAALESLF
ncbi:hypothetical protein [Citreimonas salinaria]|uniref:Uncharacterized protein n=1 Tax=Citreimonas salinaria TaxID=321339 RepID=A0A1H3HS82_9RHOB|nr:hypothetical protein [Citreimonas salinaria]SDY18333.1 hypothetical protein SAMN05444340_104135 [Citreimonas salinaria]